MDFTHEYEVQRRLTCNRIRYSVECHNATIPLTANQEVSRYTDLANSRYAATKGTDSMSVYIDGTPPAPESVIVSSSIKTESFKDESIRFTTAAFPSWGSTDSGLYDG